MFDSFTKALSAQLQHDRLKAISFMLLASFCFSLGLLFSKFVVHDTNHAMIVFVRSVFAAFLLTPFLIKKPGGSSETKSNNRVTWLNFVEGLIGCLSTLTILLAISYMSMPEVTSITYTTPVFAILLSAVLLGEGMTLRSFLAIMVSFLALIILLKPEGDKMLNMGGVYALITALLWASRTVIGKILNLKNKQDKAFILFYTKLFHCSVRISFDCWRETPRAYQYIFYLCILCCLHSWQLFPFVRMHLSSCAHSYTVVL